MTVDEIQDIIDYAYPRIKNYYGKGKLDYPKIELWNDIYARLRGDPEARGEASKSSKAEFDVDRAIETGETYIYIYFPNVKDEEDLLRSLDLPDEGDLFFSKISSIPPFLMIF